MSDAANQLGQLVALKLRLTYRLYSRSPLALLGLFISMGVAGFLSFGGLFLCLLLFEVLQEPQRTELLYVVLAGIYFLWIASPLLGVNLNESYDLSKLFVYPIPYARVFMGAVLGNLFDPSVLVLAPVLFACILGFAHGVASAFFNALVLFLFVLHTVSLSQVLQLLLWGFLRSRRVRDWVLVVGPLLSVLIYLGQSMLYRRVSWQTVGWVALLWDSQPSHWLRFLPCGMTAAALKSVSRGQLLMAAAHVVTLIMLTAATSAIAAWLVRQYHGGELELGASWFGRRRARANHQAHSEVRARHLGATRIAALLPAPARAVMLKELRYYVRDPHWKAYLIRALAPTLLYPLVLIGSNPRGLRAFSANTLDYALFTVPASALLFSALILNGNIFASDQQGLNLLFQFSCPRRWILLGKNAATFLVIGGVAAALLTLVGLFTRRLDLLVVTLCSTLSLMLLFFGAGNLLSIFFPHRLPSRGQNQPEASGGRGCMMMIINTVAYLGVLMIATPPTLAVVLPFTFGMKSALVATMPTVLIYCVIGYWLMLRVAARELQRKEIDIIQAVRPEA